MANIGIVSCLENTGKITPEKAQNPKVAPDLQSAKSFPKLGNKRRKSLDSPPSSQPNSKRKGTKTRNLSKAAGSGEFKGLPGEDRTKHSKVTG